MSTQLVGKIKWESLAYSREMDGASFKYCVLFGKDYVAKFLIKKLDL